MKAINNNQLRQGALMALFITSYIPLFLIVIAKQLKDGSDYLCWGGWNRDALRCCATHFGISLVLAVVTIFGIGGIIVLLRNLETNLDNGQTVRVTKISNRNSEAVGYIATYDFCCGNGIDIRNLYKLKHDIDKSPTEYMVFSFGDGI